MNAPPTIEIKELGRSNYLETWHKMREFTEARSDETTDEIWVCEHDPVFTLGLAGDPSHLLVKSDIPLVKTDRGGQVTYHGLGQLVVYPLLDLKRYGLKVREYVYLLEQAIIDVLYEVGVKEAQRKEGAPGVYTPWQGAELAKIAALGIKVRKGCSYHGLSLNVKMDLQPFEQINPCGYKGLKTIDLFSTGVKISIDDIQYRIVKSIVAKLEEARRTVLN